MRGDFRTEEIVKPAARRCWYAMTSDCEIPEKTACPSESGASANAIFARKASGTVLPLRRLRDTVSEEVERMIVDRAHTEDIKKVALAQGMKTLRQAGLTQAFAGHTSIEEILRVVA